MIQASLSQIPGLELPAVPYGPHSVGECSEKNLNLEFENKSGAVVMKE